MCLSELTVIACAEGQHASDVEVQAHLADCATCRCWVAELRLAQSAVDLEPAGLIPLSPAMWPTVTSSGASDAGFALHPSTENAARAPTRTIAVGTVIADRYRIDSLLGQGGMGEVYAATHITLRTSVAIKFLRGFLDQKAEARQRFVREAQVAASLESDHIVRVFDVGEHAEVGVFVVMERLRGCDLGQALTLRERLPATSVISYAMQVCSALAEAHRRGVIHRDIKPANLFLVGSPAGDGDVLKVLDFGLSKQTSDAEWSELGLTHSRNLLGSPLYVAPEQAANARSADARADIWSLGVVMHQALVGTVPFAGGSVMEVLAQISAPSPVPSLRTQRSEIPADLDAVVLRCLAKDRSQRWPDITALASALAACAAAPENAALMAQRIAALGRDPHSRAAVPGAELAVSVGSTPRRTRRWLGLSAVCAMAVVGGGVWWWQRDARVPVKATPPQLLATPAVDFAFEQPSDKVRDIRESGVAATGLRQAQSVAAATGGASRDAAQPARTAITASAVRTATSASGGSRTARIGSAPNVAPGRVAAPGSGVVVAPSPPAAPGSGVVVAPSPPAAPGSGVAPPPSLPASANAVDPLGERK